MTDDQLDHKLTSSRHQLIQHMEGEFTKLRDLLASGFPEGDPIAHRKVHEEILRLEEDRRVLIKNITEKTVGGVVWAVLAVIGFALWEWIKGEIKK